MNVILVFYTRNRFDNLNYVRLGFFNGILGFFIYTPIVTVD